MANCINHKHPDVVKMAGELNISPVVLAAKIGVWQEKNNIIDRFPTIEEIQKPQEVNYGLKSLEILSSDKAKQIFEKGNKNNWSLDKILTELQIPKEQKQLILDLNIDDREQITLELASNYSYTVEINQGEANIKKMKEVNTSVSKYYSPSEDRYYRYTEELGWISSDKDNKNQEHDVKTPEDLEPFEYNSEYLPVTEKIKSDFYSNLTVPGGTNYTENEIATPAITPSIKGHAQFATDNGIGWFRSDEQHLGKKSITFDEWYSKVKDRYKDTPLDVIKDIYEEEVSGLYPSKVTETKTRRILEVQSDLFQKGRDRENLITRAELKDIIDKQITYQGKTYSLLFNIDNAGFHVVEKGINNPIPKSDLPQEVIDWATDIRKSITKTEDIKGTSNQFLQLLNKDNNWVTFFVKSIIQDSAKKGYEKVLFPSGNTASKVEGHATLEEFKKQKEDRIKELENKKPNILEEDGRFEVLEPNQGATMEIVDTREEAEQIWEKRYRQKYINEITQLKAELERVEGPEGFGALKPIWNFYENTVTNILNKIYGKDNVKQITDEHGNTWNELTLESKRDESTIFMKKDLSEFESEENESIFSEPLLQNRAEQKVEYNSIIDKIFPDLEKVSFTSTINKLERLFINNNDPFIADVLSKLSKLKSSSNLFLVEKPSSYFKDGVIMAYDSDTKQIYYNKDVLKGYNNSTIISTLLHELTHHITVDLLSKPYNTLTLSEKDFVDTIKKFYTKYKELNHNKDKDANFSYGFENIFEFVAEFYSNPDFRNYTKTISESWYNNFIKFITDNLRRLLNISKSSEFDKLMSTIFEYVENNELPETEGKNLYVNKNIFAKQIKEAETYDLTTIDKKADHLVKQINDKIRQLINRTKKSKKEGSEKFLESFKALETELNTLSSANKFKAITAYINSFYGTLMNLNNQLDDKFSIKNVIYNNIEYSKVPNLDAFRNQADNSYIIPEDVKDKIDEEFFKTNNFIIDNELYNNIENKAIENFNQGDYLDIAFAYEDYLSAYDLLNEVDTLISDTAKDSTLSREDKLEIKELKNKLSFISKPHNDIISKIKKLKKDSIIKLLSDPSNNKKVINKWKNKLSLEYDKISNPKESKIEWIGYQMANTYADEIKKDLEQDALSIINNPYMDISKYAKTWSDLLNINSPLINIATSIIGKMRDKIINKIHEISFVFDKEFSKYSKFNNSISMSKKYGNLIELNTTSDRYYLKGKYSIKFKEEYEKMLTSIKDEISSKYKKFAVQKDNFDSINSNNKTISLRETGSHDIIKNEELMITVNGIKTGTIVKVDNIITFSDFKNLSQEQKDSFARHVGNYNNFEEFLKNNDYAKENSEKSLKYPEIYNFINNNGSIDIISYTKEKNSKEEYEKFKKKHNIYKNWIEENTIKLENGKRIPHSKYLNKNLSKQELELLEFFQKQTKDFHTKNYKGRGGLYSTLYGAEFYKLPSKTKSSKERTLEGDIKGQVIDFATDITKTKVDDINYGEAFDSKGNELQRVKINYRGKLESKDQSLDLFTVYRAEAINAISYKERVANEYKLKLFLDIARDKQYKRKSLLGSGWAKNMFANEDVKGQTMSGEFSNELEKLKGILETHLYDITSYNEEKLFGKGDLNKLAGKLNGVTGALGMTLNLGSATVNTLNGQMMLMMERFGGKYINKSNLSKAEINYTKNLPSILADISNPVKKSFHNQMLNMFDILGGMNISKQDFLNNSAIKEILSKHNLNITNDSVEHMLNSVLTESILRSIPVMNKDYKYIDKEGNITSKENAASIFDMLYLDENGILKTKEYFKYSEYNLVDDYHTTGKQSINFLIKKNVFNMYGVYDNNYKSEISKHWYGKLIMMFKNFFLSQAQHRWKGLSTAHKSKNDLTDEDLTFNYAEQEFTEGTYITIIRTFFPLLKGLNIAMVKENLKNLSDYEKHNLRKAFLEISLTAIILPILGALLAASAGDDDDEVYFLLYSFRRLESELSQFRNLIELNRMITNPIAANRFLQNGFQVINDIFTPINFTPKENESYFDWLSENSKGDNIMLNNAFKLAPGKSLFMNTYKQRYNLINK